MVEIILTQVITLAPPLLPFPFEVIAKRILYASFPSGVPCVGLVANCSANPAISFLREGYFFASFFASFENSGVASILKSLQQLFERD